ncbi:hypothetical protein lerEdw1_009733 [Lerista edwardsae]|nr:hypothetical protein lerEdw1_009733 [Lerista edwardsae]
MALLLLAVLLGAAAAAHLNVDDDNEKIIGGFECEPHSQPWQVRLDISYGDENFMCGGSLISERWVITAAHCYEQHHIVMHLGDHDTTYVEDTEQLIEMEKAIPYPKYDNRTKNHDIMLVKLAKPAQFNAAVQPIEVSQICPVARTSCLVSGWGKTVWAKGPKKLRCLKVPVLSDFECEGYYQNRITSNMFCAGYKEGGKDSCQGDSGGPLVCNGELTGIVSWGDGCALENSPGVYTKVCKYNAWIDEVLANN